MAERSIRTVSEMSRAMMLHASLRWKYGIEGAIWPMSVDYSTYIYNHLSNDKGISPVDFLTDSTVPRHKLKHIHVFGCPVYILDPVLQAGKKLPRWQPRSHRGVFTGLSPRHSSDMPLIINLQTGSIFPQYHVVFDDTFTTVSSIPEDQDPPSFLNEIDLEAKSLQIHLDPNVDTSL